jgi:hypothetical protein
MPAHRKPTELLELSGAFDEHPNRRRPVGPKSERGIGDPPPSLAPDEAACWHEFIANAPAGVLTSGDRTTLEALARLWAKSRREWLIGSEWSNLRSLLGELGATPASRSKIAAATPEERPPANPWDVPAPADAPGPPLRQ